MPQTVTTATTTIRLAKVTITRPNNSPVQRIAATTTVTPRQGTTSLLLINVSTVSTTSSTLLGILIT